MIRKFLSLLVFLLYPTVTYSQENIEEQIIQTVEKLQKSVVIVSAKQKTLLEESLPNLSDSEEQKILLQFLNSLKKIKKYSSGIIWSEDGYIVTVGDIIANAEEIEVELFDGSKYKADMVGYDKQTNIGVLKIMTKDLHKINFDKNFKPKVGNFVVAIGNPFGLKSSVSLGIVSGSNRTLVTKTGSSRTNLIQITASVNPGDAGGIVATKNGNVIGMISSTYEKSYRHLDTELNKLGDQLKKFFSDTSDSSSAVKSFIEIVSKARIKWDELIREGGEAIGFGHFFNEGINFAIPIETIDFVATQLIKSGKVDRSWLGIYVEEVPIALRKHLNLQKKDGVLIVGVLKDSPAYDANLKEFDIILEVNSNKIEDINHLEKLITGSKSDEWVNFLIIREGKKMNLKAKLGKKEGKNTE